MNLIRSIINFFGFNDAIVDGIGERGMRDSSIIRYGYYILFYTIYIVKHTHVI